jgi:hypothetical protein
MGKVSLVVSLLAAGWVTGCMGGGAGAPPAITVTVTSVPSTANGVQANAQVQFTATVTNDSQNQGVTWAVTGASCSGAGNPCGTLSFTNTASGQATTYTAPNNPPATNSVTLTATALADSTKSAQVTFGINPAPTSVQITSPNPLPTSVQTNTMVQFTATVANDPQSKGVSWTLSGPSCAGAGTCGTLSLTKTASGQPTIYIAPNNPPSPNASLTLTATALVDNTKVQATFTIVTTNPNNARLNGHYVFVFGGFDNNGNTVVRAGVFFADSNGTITGGVEDISVTGQQPMKNQAIAPSAYTVDVDNRGSMVLGGVTYRFALSAVDASGVASQGQFVEFDINTSTGVGIEGSGRFALQAAAPFSFSTVAGPFAFGGDGNDNSGKRVAALGRLIINSDGTTTSGVIDIALAGEAGGNFNATLSCSFTDADNTLSPFGRMIATFTPTPQGQSAATFAFYIVSANEMFFIDVDPTTNNVAHFQGFARRQIVPVGRFTNASATGNMIFYLNGADTDLAGAANAAIGLVNPGGTTAGNGQGNITGFWDGNDGGNITTNGAITGTYSIALNGRGTITFIINGVTTRPFTWYVLGVDQAGQNRAFLMEGTTASPATDVQFGFAESQAAGPYSDTTIAGKWGAGSAVPPVQNVHDISGAATLDATASPAPLTGTVDETKFSAPFEIPDEGLNGNYGPTSGSGRAAATISTGGGVIWIVRANRFLLLTGANTGNTKPQVSIFDRQ